MRPDGKKVIIGILSICLFIQPIYGSGNVLYEAKSEQKCTKLDWDKLMLAVKNYDSNPAEDKARAILEIIPETMPDKQTGNDDRALEYILDRSPRFLEKVESGDEYLAEAAFRLYFIVLPGGALHDLGVSLSRMLVKRPDLYLRLLKKYKPQFPSYLDYPLTYVTYNDLVPDERYEIQEIMDQYRIKIYKQRLKALQMVNDPEYLDLRDECISILEKELKRRIKK